MAQPDRSIRGTVASIGVSFVGLAIVAAGVGGAAIETSSQSQTADAAPKTTLVTTRRVAKLIPGTGQDAYAKITLGGDTDVTCALDAPLAIASNNTQQVENVPELPGPIVRTELTIVNGSTTQRTIELVAPITAAGQEIECAFSTDDIANTVQQHNPQSATRDAAVAYTQTTADQLVPQPKVNGTDVAATFVITPDEHNLYDAKYKQVVFTFAGAQAADNNTSSK